MSLNNYLLFILLMLVIYFDVTKRKIPNFLTFPVMLWGLLSYTIIGRFDGFLFSLYGLLLGIVILLIPFAFGAMGGGDVKLLGAIGALKGASFILVAAIYTAIFGGIIALLYLACKGRLLVTLKKGAGFVFRPFFTSLYYTFNKPVFNNIALYFDTSQVLEREKPLYFPYGVPIALGTILALIKGVTIF
ncbi:MAG: prepilin peptidase [Bacillota bacterium]